MSSTALQTRNPLEEALAVRNVDGAQWQTLTQSLYPGAKPESVLLVIDYCRARKLDPLKKPCHIVPMWIKDATTGNGGMRDVVMPGIYELRTTAQRTGEYRGHTVPEFGPDIDFQGVTVPEYCALTALRGPRGEDRDEFPVKVYFAESVGTDKNGKINDRWRKAPRQMLEKCAEAAALRKAFPDELGGDHIDEEMDGQQTIDVTPAPIPMPKATGQAAAGAPATSQPEPTKADAPKTDAPKLETPTAAGTMFRRDAVRVTNMELKRGKAKVNPETGEETPGRPFAVVTLSTGEVFQCWHQNLNVSLEAWWKAKTLLDVDAKTNTNPTYAHYLEKATAVQG